MSDKLYVKHYFGESQDTPEEVENGRIIYEEDTQALYVDQNNVRIRYNPPANWNETNADDPAYIENKPTLGTVASYDVAQDLQDENDIPTIGKMYEAMESALYWYELKLQTYGVLWDYSNPSTKLTRTGDASEFADPVPATSVSGTGSSPFDNIYPWSEMKEVNILSDGTIIDKSSADFSYNNDTMVYIPEFYYKVKKDTTNSTHSWSISGKPMEGYKRHPGSGKYIGKYHMTGSSTGVFSKTGAVPLVNTTHANFRSYAKSKGEHWRILDAAVWSAFQMLYLVEFANWNSQEMLGEGNNQSSLVVVGGTDGAEYGIIKATNADNQYRYVEDFDSNVVNMADGLIFSNRAVYASDNPLVYGDTVAGLTNLGISLPSTTGYITNLAYNEKYDYLFIPNNVGGGSESTYITDYLIQDTGVNGYYVGGRYGSYGSGGIFLFGATISSYGTHAFFGSRLIYDPDNS